MDFELLGSTSFKVQEDVKLMLSLTVSEMFPAESLNQAYTVSVEEPLKL